MSQCEGSGKSILVSKAEGRQPEAIPCPECNRMVKPLYSPSMTSDATVFAILPPHEGSDASGGTAAG